MNNPKPKEGEASSAESSISKGSPALPNAQQLHDALKEMVERPKEKLFLDSLREIAMLYDQGELLENEVVSKLIRLLNLKKFPITRRHLEYLGIQQFTLTHEDMEDRTVFDVLTGKKKEWMSIEKEDMPEEFGLDFTLEEVGNEMRGMLVHNEAKGFALRAPDLREYPLDSEAVAPLESYGGVMSFVGKEIIVEVTVRDSLTMKIIPQTSTPQSPEQSPESPPSAAT